MKMSRLYKAYYISKIIVDGRLELPIFILLHVLGAPREDTHNDLKYAILHAKGYNSEEKCEFEYHEIQMDEFNNAPKRWSWSFRKEFSNSTLWVSAKG